MEEQSTEGKGASSVQWGNLEAWLRTQVQGFIQQILDEEVSVFLAWPQSQRRPPIPGGGYRNGYGKPRPWTLSCGTMTVRRSRVRDGEARFVSHVLPLSSARVRQSRRLCQSSSSMGSPKATLISRYVGFWEETPRSPAPRSRG